MSCYGGFSQISTDTINKVDSTTQVINYELTRYVLDKNTKEGLPYANIYVLHKNIGAISNEQGEFSLNITGLKKTDTLRIQYMGYSTLEITIGEADSLKNIYLKEEIFNLSETIVFGTIPDVKKIVENIIENKDANYKKSNTKQKIFVRERYISDIKKIKLDHKKSNIEGIDENLTKNLETKIPRHTTSYTDFLGFFYSSIVEDDTLKHKTEPIKTVSLKEVDLSELEDITSVFENVFKDTKEKEYWKVRTGILSQKVTITDDSTKNDTINDTINDNRRKLVYFNQRLGFSSKFALMDDKDNWEFLYKTGRYNYKLIGGTRVGGEDVYIIDFTPKSSGDFEGRMYVSMSTFALIRADYQYGKGKTGTDFDLFSVGYTEDKFMGSIYFKKNGDTYDLVYFSKKAGSVINFDRSLSLLKKRKRFLFDKTLKDIKVGVNITLVSEADVEFLVLENETISHEQFNKYKQPEYMDVIFVDKFDDKLWQGYSIIEPTKQMRDYKKQGIKN